MIRNRREDYIDEEIEFHKHEDNKPYPYFFILRSLFYAIILGICVGKFLSLSFSFSFFLSRALIDLTPSYLLY